MTCWIHYGLIVDFQIACGISFVENIKKWEGSTKQHCLTCGHSTTYTRHHLIIIIITFFLSSRLHLLHLKHRRLANKIRKLDCFFFVVCLWFVVGCLLFVFSLLYNCVTLAITSEMSNSGVSSLRRRHWHWKMPPPHPPPTHKVSLNQCACRGRGGAYWVVVGIHCRGLWVGGFGGWGVGGGQAPDDFR